jgi:hypothetical protein
MKIVDALMTLGLAVGVGSLAPVPSVGQGTPTTSEYRYTIVDYPNQLQIPGAFGTLPQGISTEGVVSGTFIDGSGDAHGFVARPRG